ncbi:serrate RNA effector molecule homolog isoform X2 [Dysidea avara]
MKTEREAQTMEDFKARHQAFTTLLDLGLVKEVPICVNVLKQVTKVMDSAVILMEGGNTDDLKVLDIEDKQEKPRRTSEVDKIEAEDDKQLEKYDLEATIPEEPEEKVEEDKEEKGDEEQENDQMEETDVKEDDVKDSDVKDNDVKEENDTVEEQKGEAEKKTETNENNDEMEKKNDEMEKNNDEIEKNNDEIEKNNDEMEKKNDEMEKVESPEEKMATEEEALATVAVMEEDGTPQAENDGTLPAENDEKANEDTNTTTTTETETTPAVPAAPRALHLTKSVYIRHISPMVKSSDILEVCQQFPSYLRIAVDGPDVEKGYELRGWVTFSGEANIREIISQLCSIKNSQLTCMANRDLTRRVKHMSSDAYPYHKDVVCNDIQLACQLIKHLDCKHHLFEPDSQDNPLIEEAQNALANAANNSSENKEKSEEGEQEEEEEGSVHDDSDRWPDEGDSLLQVNDCLLWYLRIVHSVDYYGGNMIMQEHRMPHRCGIITARPTKPDIISVQPKEVNTYLDSAKNKVQPHMEQTELLSDQEAADLGKKDVDSEIEKFISDNTKEISKEKYLCPLSGKKFRGPEFVRKHIFNKHASKLEQVKQEVEFFHNYLYDPKRPMPLDSELASEEHQDSNSFHVQPPPDFVPWGSPHMMMFRRGMFPQRGFDMFPFRGRMRRRGGGRGRRMVEYHDLDAPADMEF